MTINYEIDFGVFTPAELSEAIFYDLNKDNVAILLRSLSGKLNPKGTYKIGDRFKHDDGDIFLIVSVDEQHALLINTETGYRYGSVFEVSVIGRITEEEFMKTFNFPHHRKNLTLITED